jgi:hypothetical protein
MEARFARAAGGLSCKRHQEVGRKVKIRRLRPTPGVLIGTIALVFAFTGGAVAAGDINTNDIAKKAVTGSRIAKDAIKSGKIADGKVKAKDLADDVIPDVPDMAYGRVNKNGTTVAPETGAVGIAGTSSGGDGLVCYDLAFAPVSGTATVARSAGPATTVELVVNPPAGCAAPYTDAATVTRLASNGNPVDRDVYVDFIGQ